MGNAHERIEWKRQGIQKEREKKGKRLQHEGRDIN
jgi:hypothetical protein